MTTAAERAAAADAGGAARSARWSPTIAACWTWMTARWARDARRDAVGRRPVGVNDDDDDDDNTDDDDDEGDDDDNNKD